MMRVLVDARMLLGRFSGVPRYVTRVVDELAVRDDVQVIALCGDQLYAPWSNRSDIELILTCFSRRDRTPIRRWQWESFRLRRWIMQAGADVYHATWNSGIPPRCPVPTVLTVHDLIPWHEPAYSFRSPIDSIAYRRMISGSARRATIVTTVSDSVRADVIDTLCLNAVKVHTVYNGADVVKAEEACQSEGTHDRRPFVLYVGGMEPRKNVETLFRAMAAYWRLFGDLGLRMTGDASSLGHDARAIYDRLERRDFVQFLGHPSDTSLTQEYSSAAALVFPSRAEGFGLPAIEAMALGCPVVAARAGSLPEVVGESGMLVDSDDAVGFAKAIRRVVSDAVLRGRLIEAGQRRAASFTWRSTAERLNQLYLHATGRGVQGNCTGQFFRTGPFHAGVSVASTPVTAMGCPRSSSQMHST